jgi:hypothetical protein
MQAQNPAKMAGTEPPPVSGDELAEGLMLVRASTLKMIRLQLAMERQDRRVALEEVDDLLAIDRRLQDYIADVPGGDRQLLFREELDAERSALDREKLTLAGGVFRREEPVPPVPQPQPFELDAPDAASWGTFEFAEAERRGRHRAIGRFALLLVILSASAAAAWLWACPEAWPALQAMVGGIG